MSTLALRQSFAKFLADLAGSDAESEWVTHVITHYRDEELEEIRRALVRRLSDDKKLARRGAGSATG